MAVYVGYQGAKNCTDGPQPGARGMMQWFLAKYRSVGGTNLGIYNCRTVRGGSTTSLHGEGRAVDFGINPHGASYGTALADQLRNSSKELGIQCIIWNRRIWSGAHPHAGWRNYSGTNPHVDHLHVELSWATAKKDADDVVRLLNTYVGSGTGKPGDPTLRAGSKGTAVRELQGLLNKFGFSVGTVDGIFGPKTETAVKNYQKARGLTVDGIVGPTTWAAMRKENQSGGSGPGSPSSPTLRAGSRGTAVRELQGLLNKFGFSVGTVDGIFGPKTETAVKNYQKARGLTVDGIVGPTTWAALRKAGQPR